MLDTVNCWTQYCAEHSNMQETIMLEKVICWTNCILDICLLLLFLVLNMPSKYATFHEFGPLLDPFSK